MALDARQRAYAQHALAGLPRPLRLLVFSRDGFCPACETAEAEAAELADLVPDIAVNVVPEQAEDAHHRLDAFGIEDLPALAIATGDGQRPDNGIRFYGFPSGCSFTAFVDAMRRAAFGEAAVGPTLASWLAARQKPLRLEVFVTPGCAHCAPVVSEVTRLAQAAPAIVRADIIDATEFPERARAAGVQGVPLTVVDGHIRFEGSLLEAALLQHLQSRVATPTNSPP
jgi:alkyl hydroperoxide reductase subunit AhpF